MLMGLLQQDCSGRGNISMFKLSRPPTRMVKTSTRDYNLKWFVKNIEIGANLIKMLRIKVKIIKVNNQCYKIPLLDIY